MSSSFPPPILPCVSGEGGSLLPSPPLYQPSIPATDTGHSPFVHSPPSDDTISTTKNVRAGAAEGATVVLCVCGARRRTLL